MDRYEYSLVFATEQAPDVLKALLAEQCLAGWRVDPLEERSLNNLPRYAVSFELADDARTLMGDSVLILTARN